jgi:hypothetical protein
MNMTNIIKTAVWMALLAGMSVAGIKYVAVVETDVDVASGASAEINAAEVREITAELRRQATENLPSGRYSVMTSETVMSMGGAVLEECAEENCVIALGSKIGADYIVRGTISKFQTRFTLKVEMYETDNGMLIATTEPVRTENLGELLEKATTVSADMYRKFAGENGVTQKSKTVAGKSESAKSTKKMVSEDFYLIPKYQIPLGTTASWGGVNLEFGAVRWWLWNKASFGIDASFSIDAPDGSGAQPNTLAGLAFNLSNIYDLGNQLQFVYGVSAGMWLFIEEGYKYGDGEDEKGMYWEYNFIAPFVKLRWNFVELTYRGLLGYNEITQGTRGEVLRSAEFNYSHQLMLGLYFVIPKRER